ncbi:MAG: hypothetical protein LBH05_08585 [Deferribacteraceae bacterium]|jgi:hypothetical protein|nr:hypothetical protein [Deferribacteraceae bacterium]
MYKKALIIFSFFICVSCAIGDLEMVYNPVVGLSTGAWQVAALVELNANFSSLLYDKTDAKFEKFTVRPFQILPENCAFYIMPVIYTDPYSAKRFDETYSRIIASYFKLNNYGYTVDSPDEADYVIVLDITESPQMFHGKNSSLIELTIMEPDETPVFFTKTFVSSKSDKNFYYQPSKSARPVKYLTLKGFERILYEALPQAFS